PARPRGQFIAERAELDLAAAGDPDRAAAASNLRRASPVAGKGAVQDLEVAAGDRAAVTVEISVKASFVSKVHPTMTVDGPIAEIAPPRAEEIPRKGHRTGAPDRGAVGA